MQLFEQILESVIKKVNKLPVEDRLDIYHDITMGIFREAYSGEVALKAQQYWEDAFEKLNTAESQLEVGFDFIPKIVQAGRFKSNSEVRKLFEQGGVRLRMGKRSFIVKLSKDSNGKHTSDTRE